METIVAISTAPGVGGIGIIRMSGDKSFDILKKIFKPKKDQEIKDIKGYTIKYGNILDKKKNIVDEVLVSYFKSPKSYTTENMCEINSHGGTVMMNKILELCIENGAVLAEPGEFTKRAFLNGRIDLSQAEAVIDVINSKTDKELNVSINQLEGGLSTRIKEIRREIISVLSDIEASIDYPEYDIEEVTDNKILESIEKVEDNLEKLELSFENGKILKEGINTAIIGRPNAGKSSLLNLLLNEERAIVTDIAGTTRDTIEEFISVNGIPLKIIDTAGIRETVDEVEKIGVKKAKEIAERSDVIIGIFDISKEINSEDQKILEIMKDKNSIILLNKIDLVKEFDISKFENFKLPIIKFSTKTGEGLKELYKQIEKMFNIKEITNDGELIVTNARHKFIIKDAQNHLKEAIDTINMGMPIDIVSTSLKQVLEDLGKITGESVAEDIINEIFSKFCLGK